MSKVFISRLDRNIPWGFRLQGGLEYNEPLILTNIQSNSPADGKIDPGDMLIEIAGTNVTQMTHKDVLELIQHCGNALYLTIYKVGHSYPSNTKPTRRFSQQQQPSFPFTNIPPAPVFDENLIINTTHFYKNQEPVTEIHTSYEQTSNDFSNLPAVLAKSLSRSGGPKPFTYTPGGLDLSKLLDSARNRRQRPSRSNSEDTSEILNQRMSRRTILPPDQMNQHHYTSNNPIQPFSYVRQQPTQPKKHIQYDTDAITQSRSFQLLEGWIADSEKTVAALIPTSSTSLTNSSAVARAVHDEQNNTSRRYSNPTGPATLPSRSFRYLQEQYNNDDNNNNPTTISSTTTSTTRVEETITPNNNNNNNNTGALRRSSDAHTPSRSFKYLQDHYPVFPDRTSGVNNRQDLAEIYLKPPPSFRAREPEAPRYTGASVPSRSFRFLQMMTQDDQHNDSTSVPGYTKPQEHLLKKYDEQNLSTPTNRLNEHPSRSFKYLQELTGEHKSTEKQNHTTQMKSTDNGTSDF